MAKNNGMKNRFSYSSSQLLNFTKDSYLERTGRPFYGLVFLLPFIVFYEVGTILINTDILRHAQIRVVAFVWLENFIEYVGFSSKLAWAAPPFVVVVILLSLQIASRNRWYCVPADLGWMTIESIILAVPLIVLGLFLITSARPAEQQDIASGSVVRSAVCCQAEMVVQAGEQDDFQVAEDEQINSVVHSHILAGIVTGIGAGIYEELVFRLILICVLMIFFCDLLKLGHNQSIVLSVLIAAALFSAHHHIAFFSGQQADVFDLTEFVFRTIAGIYFAVVFAVRGFGITAGTHAFYNIIAVFIQAYLSRG
jgi:membrane protease YdiL (CAAX protease family)